MKSVDVSLNISVSCNMWECRRHICGIRGFEAKWRWLWTLSLQFAFMSPNQPPFSRSKNLPFRNLLTLTDFRKSSRQGKGDIVGIVLMWYYARSILDFWGKRICYCINISIRSKYSLNIIIHHYPYRYTDVGAMIVIVWCQYLGQDQIREE